MSATKLSFERFTAAHIINVEYRCKIVGATLIILLQPSLHDGDKDDYFAVIMTFLDESALEPDMKAHNSKLQSNILDLLTKFPICL